MARVAVLGLGAMGSRTALRLLQAGHDLTVWNRSAQAAAPLVAAGARLADSPREAASAADVAISMVRDDDASKAVWLASGTGALEGLGADAIGIESSTLTSRWMRMLAGHFREADRGFLDAPVAGSRPQAEAGQLIYLVGGELNVLARVEPVLRAMGGAIHHAGPAGSGTTLKLAVNALLGVQVAALAEIIGFLGRSGTDIPGAIGILSATPVWSPAANGAAASMSASDFAPMFPVDLVEKDLRNTLADAEAVEADMPVAAASRDVFAKAISQGLGPDNLTAVGRLYR